MQPSESIRFAGDVSIDKIEIVSNNGFIQNVTNQVIAIEMFEDIFNPLTTGNVVLKDSLDLANLFPFTGEEFINLIIRTPTYDEPEKIISQQYYIYKMTDRELLGDRSVAYILHFISVEGISDLNKKISKTFGGLISDIAKTLITDKINGLETKKKVFIEQTSNNVNYISNFWSPLRNLNYLSGNAANSNGSANYLFYENRAGFNFNSLEYLYQQPIRQEFVYDAYSRDFGVDGRAIRNVEEDYKRVLEISIPEAFNYMENNRAGMFSNRMINYDLTTKQYIDKKFDLLTEFPNRKHLNDYPLASKKNINRANSLIFFYPKYYNNFNNYKDVTNAHTIQSRMATLKAAEGSKVQITVPGRTDYTVGMKVKLTLNKMNPITADENSSDVTDKLFSGNYIISAVNHYINRQKHECSIELIKDSYGINLDQGGR